MRKVVGGLLLLVASVAIAQTSQDLRNRYGEPDVERFTPRPGIGLTVQYGSDHLACQMLIQPPEPILGSSQEKEARYMSSDAVSEILEEVAPATTRGKKTNEFHMVSGCNNFDGTEYENMTIFRSTHNCLPLQAEREMSTTVRFKRYACQSQK